MNALIFAVCVNIALVTAQTNEYYDILLKLLKERRFNNADNIETNEPVEAISIMPGFYLQKPEELSKSLFKYPKGKTKYIPVSSGWNNIAPRKNITAKGKTRKIKVLSLNGGSKNDYLTAKIFNAVKNLVKPRESTNYRFDETHEPYPNTVTKNNDYLVKHLLAKMATGIKNTVDSQKSENYMYGVTLEDEDISNTFSQNADKVLVNNWLTKAIKGIQEENDDGGSNMYNTEEKTSAASPKNKKLMEKIFKAVDSMKRYQGNKKQHHPSFIVIEANSHSPKSHLTENIEDVLNGKQQEALLELSDELDNDANEIFDDGDSDLDNSRQDYRRNGKDSGADKSCRDGSESNGSDETEHEKNPGNPFTIHKNKYKQNWPWNHYMDGDHMNINPFGPQFSSLGPSGPELFFGRKWWYFNQDDYKPMG